MSTKYDGGNAFPLDDPDHHAFRIKNTDDLKRIQSGMSLRDYFAAKAIQGFCSRTAPMTYELLAEQSYRMADAMLRERDK